MAYQKLTSKSFFGKDTNRKFIQEYFGLSTQDENLSLALMTAVPGWKECFQIAEFDEYIYVISGQLCVQTTNKMHLVDAGQAIKVSKGERVQFSTAVEPAVYVAICTPAFQEHLVKRDEK